MIATARVSAALVALCVLAAACTGADDPGPDTPSAEESRAEDVDGPTTTTTGSVGVQQVAGVDIDVDDDILEAAHTWIVEESGLSDMLQEELFLAEVTTTRDVIHLTFVQQHDDVAVRGAQFIVHVRDTGEVLGASQSLTTTLPGEDTTEELDEAEAVDIAVKAVPGTPVGTPTVRATWLENGPELRLGWEVLVTTTAPTDDWAVVVDATTGDVLSVDRLSTDAHAGHTDAHAGHTDAHAGHTATPRAVEVAQGGGCNAPAPPSACIFVVDPFYASGTTTISPGQANQTLVGVPLANLDNPGDGNLVGRYAAIDPDVAATYRDPDNVFGEGGRGGQDPTFEAGMTYYWIDYTQQLVQGLGYDYHADDPVEFVPIDDEFQDNAFYLFTDDTIHMGGGADGVTEAEDAQGIIHEYGHALLQAAVPNIVSDEGGAFHEGFSDLVSVFTTLEFRNGDIGCLFHWAERGSCIRRIDTDKAYPRDLVAEVHRDAEIYTGAVWDVFEAVLARDTGLVPSDCQDRQADPCDAVRDEVYGTLLGSLPFLTPALDLNDAAAAFAASDATFNDGRNATIILDAFAAHGLTAEGSSGVQVMRPDDLMDLDRTNAQVALKIVHAFRGDLQVDLGVVDASGELQCTLQLKSPDGVDGADNITGRYDVTDTDCAAHLPPGPDDVWVLRVVDAFDLDVGTLFQFAVLHNGTRYAAGGLPLAIPDADPQGIVATVGADLGSDSQPMAEEEGAPAAPATASGVEVDIDIAHTYVGDLLVQVGVLDADGTALCRVDVATPDPEDASDDLVVTADLSACAAHYPPGPGATWALRVVDNASQDVGEVRSFVLRGPDGQRRAGSTPVTIPDADETGVLVTIGS